MTDVPISPFGRLIERVVQSEFGGVQDALAKAMGVSPQTISRYKNDYPLKSIIPGILTAFAQASGVSLVEVVRVALQSAELPDAYPPAPRLVDLVREDADLSHDQKRMIVALLNEAARDNARPRLNLVARRDDDTEDEPVS